MLLSDLILDKRGSLGKVWLSAHQERRLSKQQALGVDVEESVGAILTESRPMALRVSGQLMLGVVRIYGRKVQYLMDDCRDTRERISMTFRPGAVDLPEDQIRASRNAITFEPVGNIDAVDMFDWSFNMPTPDESARGMHTAPLTQTNLRSREYGAFNFGRPKAPSIFGDGSSRQGSPGDSGHLDSQDFEPIDLELGLDDFSMEFGRDAMSERSRSKSTVPQTPSVLRDSMELDRPFGADNAFGGDDFAPMDLGLDDLPELEAEQPVANGADAERRRASSELSTPPPPDEQTLGLSPRMAKRLAEAQGGKPKQKRVRIVCADEELELPDEDFANPQDDSPIIGEENFIPANPEAVRLRDIREDPVAYFMPMTDTKIFAGPAGLAPELADLFSFPINALRRVREAEPEERRAPKRQRRQRATGLGADEDDYESDVEGGRRESREPSAAAFDGGFDTIDMDADMTLDGVLSPPGPTRRSPTREASMAPSRISVPYAADGEHPLALFDTRVFNSQGELETAASQLESTPRAKAAATAGGDETPGAGGFSKNTAMAMGVLRRELDAIEAESAAEKKVRFNNVARGASKRAAAGMFFELLVLGTRDCVALEQKRAFATIDVRPKERFWELAT